MPPRKQTPPEPDRRRNMDESWLDIVDRIESRQAKQGRQIKQLQEEVAAMRLVLAERSRETEGEG